MAYAQQDSTYRLPTAQQDVSPTTYHRDAIFNDQKIESLADVASISSIKGNSSIWKRSWVRLGPLSGLFSLFLSVGGIFASFAILYASNGAATASWRYQPSTYLAIVTAVANLAIRYAAIQGAIISWWRRALRGTDLASLHYDWATGAAAWKSILSRRIVSWMLLPFFASILVAIDGPLLQRASTVVRTSMQIESGHLEVSISPEVPRGISGYYQYSPLPTNVEIFKGESNDYALFLGANITAAMHGWRHSIPQTGIVKGCPGTCHAKVRAPTLAVTSCTEHTYDSNFLGLSPREKYQEVGLNPPIGNVPFMVNIGLLVREQELINLTVVYSDTSQTNCSGRVTAKTCLLHSAIGLYDITIDDDVVTLDSPSDPEILTSSNNSLATTGTVWPTYDLQGYTQSTLAGIASGGYYRYESLVNYITPHPDPDKELQNVQAFYQQNIWMTDDFFESPDLGANDVYPICASYRDPTNAVRGGLNELLFRVGAEAARGARNFTGFNDTLDPGVETVQTVISSQGGLQNVYQTNFWYFFGAAVVEVCCIGVILPLYWGWWHLGRAVSFSPLEIAKAFGSPILANANSNLSAKRIADQMGALTIQYGLIQTTGYTDSNEVSVESQVGFASPHIIQRPEHGTRIDG